MKLTHRQLKNLINEMLDEAVPRNISKVPSGPKTKPPHDIAARPSKPAKITGHDFNNIDCVLPRLVMRPAGGSTDWDEKGPGNKSSVKIFAFESDTTPLQLFGRAGDNLKTSEMQGIGGLKAGVDSADGNLHMKLNQAGDELTCIWRNVATWAFEQDYDKVFNENLDQHTLAYIEAAPVIPTVRLKLEVDEDGFVYMPPLSLDVLLPSDVDGNHPYFDCAETLCSNQRIAQIYPDWVAEWCG